MPFLSLAENIFLGNEHSTRGFINWNETLRHATEVLRRVGLDDHPETGSPTSASASSSWWRSRRRCRSG